LVSKKSSKASNHSKRVVKKAVRARITEVRTKIKAKSTVKRISKATARRISKAITKRISKITAKRISKATVKRINTSKANVAKAKTKLKTAKATIKKGVMKEPKAPEPPKIDKEREAALMKKVVTILSDSRVRQNLIGIGGENALAIVRNFTGNQSDDDLAKKLKIKISDVRATLNKLHNEGLVNYIREKDSETGWYSYSWSLNHDRMERWASNNVGLKIDFGSESEYYFCPACGTESITNFESASTCEFRCERCNKMMEFIDEKGILELFEKKK